jgi:D-sedoheptulose 7-phosphate isomerase
MLCGNGGGATAAEHLAARLVNLHRGLDGPGLPALVLHADTTFLMPRSAERQEEVFARHVEALGQPGDVLIGIGARSARNLVHAFETARHHGLRCIALVGDNEGELPQLADTAIVLPPSAGPHLAAVQMAIVHLLCEVIKERALARPPVQRVTAAAPTGRDRRRRRPRPVEREAVPRDVGNSYDGE